MEEKRSIPRMRALKAARIILTGGHSTFDCMVRNLTGKGARLVMESTIGVPDTFGLRFEDGTMHECSVRWRKVSELGVSFDG
jgi:hypothetical protein